MRQLETADLNEYIDPCIKYKCNFAVIVMIGFALVEHSMSIAVKFSAVQECGSNSTSVLEAYMKYNYYWICAFDYLPSSYWRKLRIDYNRVSRLVRCFDDSINGIVLISFASNLYFSCLKLHYTISNGFHLQRCLNYPNYNEKDSTGFIPDYLLIMFATYSLVFVLLRSLAVAIIAAKVHSASLVVAPVLYSVPSPTFCTEIQRFIEQIHGNTVALTGLNFFYVNKELILTIFGTIVTYELVLLQFVKS
ncbi:gustatory receptor for sugar taste 64f-like [Maniola jurtina]|uniref:gustatory receptor for sugar taste 64f-like n=1 Tax=Maniola jurtina TaxID=191418 RepID=UPI001E68E666|nr:gustatory receptor for sugar taste 64f-like [Maniola jurtina]